MSYDAPLRITYNINAADLHTADITKKIRGPSGKRGRLVDVLGTITTTCAGASTTPVVKVGKSGTLAESFQLDLSTGAAGTAIVGSANAGAIKRDTSNFQPIMAADTDVHITLVAATGSGAAGVADLMFVLEWF